MKIFVGFDDRELDAYDVCLGSIKWHTPAPVNVTKLDQHDLRAAGIYTRSFHYDHAQRIDDIDGRPFSTDFSFSRFAVPHLMGYQGWALFCDCDFLFTQSMRDLFELADPQYAVQVVKRDYQPADGIKMDGQAQQAYPRKLWSSLVLWNCSHPANRAMTPEAMNTQTGSWLHGFSWLRDGEIGELPLEWNWIPGVDVRPPFKTVPFGIHYSLGTPSMPGYEHCEYADLWKSELRRLQAAWRPLKFTRKPERTGASR